MYDFAYHRPKSLADAVSQIVTQPLLAERLRRAALSTVRGRTWEASLKRLADGYAVALAEETSGARRIA